MNRGVCFRCRGERIPSRALAFVSQKIKSCLTFSFNFSLSLSPSPSSTLPRPTSPSPSFLSLSLPAGSACAAFSLGFDGAAGGVAQALRHCPNLHPGSSRYVARHLHRCTPPGDAHPRCARRRRPSDLGADVLVLRVLKPAQDSASPCIEVWRPRSSSLAPALHRPK